ncbi:MAG: PLP-dependent aminotransferase family protein [Acetobacteraceae bacterium]
MTPRQELIFIVSGAHVALLGILGSLVRPGDVVLSEALTYPGIRSVAGQLGLTLIGLPLDEEGLSADAFAEACERAAPKALYVNPTLLNPTTHTITAARRAAIVEIARRFRVMIIEDDACGLLPVDARSSELRRPRAGADMACGHAVEVLRGGLAPGLCRRAGHTVPAGRLPRRLRTATVMASPLTTALASQWILDGTADALLAAIRQETGERHKIAAAILPRGSFRGDPAGFHLWMPLARPWTRSAFIGQVRPTGIGIVGERRLCRRHHAPGGSAHMPWRPDRPGVAAECVEFVAHSLAETPARASASL